MKPKEKAMELYGFYYMIFPLSGKDCVKQGAILCVDEIIKANPIEWDNDQGIYFELTEYWQQVKQELQKM